MPVAGDGGGVERIEHEEVVLHQRMDEATAGFLRANATDGRRSVGGGRRSSRGALPGCWRGEVLGFGLVGREQADIMFLVGPIQADEGGVLDGRRS